MPGVIDNNLHYHGKILLRSDEGAAESSLPTHTPNTDDGHVLTDQDGPEDLSSYEIMEVSKMSQLMELSMGLQSLKIEGCDALEDITEGMMENKPSLQHLYIIDCYSLKSFPEKKSNHCLKVSLYPKLQEFRFSPTFIKDKPVCTS